MMSKDNKETNLEKYFKVALREGPGRVGCRKTLKPPLQRGTVLVKILYAGICGSDIARVKDKDPKWDSIVLGHEAVGIIEDISNETSKKTSLRKADKVAIIPLIPCRNCYFCGKGFYSSCSGYSFIGSRINGAFSEYMLVDVNNLIKLPDDKDLEKYTLLEPLTVALHAIYKADIKFGKKVVIFGAGTIGLLIFQILRKLTYCEVVMIDIDEFKLKLAEKLGSIHNINFNNKSINDYIRKNICNYGVDIVFEVSGANIAKKKAIEIISPNGNIILVGTSAKDVLFDSRIFELLLRKEVKVKGAWMSYSSPFPGTEWETGVRLLKDDLIDVNPIITHRYNLKNISEAFEMILDSDENNCKVIINM